MEFLLLHPQRFSRKNNLFLIVNIGLTKPGTKKKNISRHTPNSKTNNKWPPQYKLLKVTLQTQKNNLILSLHDHCKSRIAPCTSKFDIYVFVMVLFAGDIDFVTHYRLVDPNKLESYAKAFVVEDDDLDTKLSFKVSKLGIFFSFHW